MLRAPRTTFAAAGTLAVVAALVTGPAHAESFSPSYTVDRHLEDSRIVESSGLARSTRFAGVLWTHNDSGDGPRVFAVDADGTTRATVTLDGAAAVDWEDMAAGPDHSIWVGDIGDNGRSRSSISVYRFTEPATLASTTVTPSRYVLRYPDGESRDAEGMMIDPSGRLYVVQKEGSGAAIFQAPATLSTSDPNTLTKVGSAPAWITAASWAPDGSSFTLANYDDAWTYPGLGAAPVTYDKPSLRQGESLEYTTDSSRILFGSEGSNSPVYTTPAPTPSGSSPSDEPAFTLSPGESEIAKGPSRFLDGRGGTSFTVPETSNSGSGLYLGTMVRAAGAGTGYLGAAQFVNGTVRLAISRKNAGSQVSLAAVRLGSYDAGADYRVVVQVAGTSTVTVQARVYRLGDDVPAWQLTVRDTSAQRITSTGDTYASGYLSSSATAGRTVPYFTQR